MKNYKPKILGSDVHTASLIGSISGVNTQKTRTDKVIK